MLRSNDGQSLVEVLIALSIFVVGIATIGFLVLDANVSSRQGVERTQAILLAKEGLEAARSIRDASFSNLTAGSHGIALSGNKWIFSATSSDTQDQFTRSITIEDLGAKEKKVTANVSWQFSSQRSGTVSLVGRLTNWTRNFGNWGAATQEATLNLSTAADGNEIALYATGSTTYAIVVRNGGTAAELYVIDVSNPASPAEVGSVEIGATVNDVAVCGNYAVVATVADSGELKVINLTTPGAPSIASTLDLTGAANALSVACTDTTVFLGRAASAQKEVYAISIANPLAPSALSTLELGTNADAAKVVLAQNNQYLYVASPVDTGELFIVSVSSPSSISLTSTFNASGGSDGTAVTAFSTYAVLGRADGTILVFDASNPASPTLISSALDIGTNVQDMAMGVGGAYIFIASNTATTPTFIVDVTTPATPSILGSVAQSADTKGIVWDYDLNRAFTAGTADAAEFAVIKPN